MRARLAIAYAGISTEVREILLKDKPRVMLDASGKGTVPVLVLQDGTVLEESLDIMLWAVRQRDADCWLSDLDHSLALIEPNDHEFKNWLDRYKYHVGYPEHSQEYYRSKACEFIQQLESRLTSHLFLLGETPRLADFAIFPFVRQFAFVDMDWFQGSDYPFTNTWLNNWLNSELFVRCMPKWKVWELSEPGVPFP